MESKGSVYNVDAGLLEELAPDLVITQDQCEVCAVSLEDVETACKAMASSPAIVTLNPSSLEDIWSDVRMVARELGVEDEGRRLAASLAARVDKISAEVGALGGRPKVACIEWIEPLMISGNWVPEVVDRAGGEAVLTRRGEHSAYTDWEDLVASNPDVIVVMPCGFDIKRTQQEMPVLEARPEWPGLGAVENRRVFLADGNQYFNRSGPRMVESIEIMVEILYRPNLDYGHRGRGWLPSD